MLAFFSISESDENSGNGIINLGGKEKLASELFEMIKAFKDDTAISREFDYPAYTFDKSSLLRLLSQDTCEGLALYFAKHKATIINDDNSSGEKDVFTIAIVSIDKDSKPCIITREKTDNEGVKIFENGIYGEEDGTGHPPRKVEEFLTELDSMIKK